MDIGTAKPNMSERQGIPHYMMDIIEPDESFNVAIYQKRAKAAIDCIYKKGKLPFLVGGSGLYVNSIVYPLDFTTATEDHELRAELYKKVEEKGNYYLHQKLAEIDPTTAKRVHPNDVKRIVRAMEIYCLTGKPMSQHKQNLKNADIPYDLIMIGLYMERSKLYEKINMRVDHMIEQGLIEEVKSLQNMGYGKDLVSMQGLGYKEIIAYLEEEHSLEEAIDILKRDTRRFAKRQLTWFRKDKRIHWVNIEDFNWEHNLYEYLIDYIDTQIRN